MSINEFVLALVVVVIGLGVADLLFSFHKLLRAGRRVRWDWLTLAYALLMLYALIVFWWWHFDYARRSPTLTIANFLPRLIFLALTFLMVAAALPDEVPVEGIDLREFYLESLRHRWGLLVISMIFSIASAVYASASAPYWRIALWASPSVVSAVLAALAMRVRATWFQALAIAWIFAVTSYFNLFLPIST